MKKVYRITILGGTDGFGKWLCTYILKYFLPSVEIIITGNNLQKGEKVAKTLGIQFSNNNIEAVKNADIIFYSVPIAYTQDIIEATLPHIKPGAFVADVTSIKKFPSVAMQQRNDIIVVPTHPMFGPYISSIAGQVIVLTPQESVKDTQGYIFIKKFLQGQKAKIIEVSPEYHDKMMAVVQGLTHLNMFVVGETMKRLDFNIADSMSFISPIYKLMISSVGRYLGQNPRLYADIQMYNDEILEVHEKFLDTAKNFHNSVKNKDSEKFCSDIRQAKEFLGEVNCEEGQEYTDKIIYLLGKQIDLLKNNTGKQIQLKSIYSGERIEGKLKEYKKGKIFFDTGEIYNIDTYEVLSI